MLDVRHEFPSLESCDLCGSPTVATNRFDVDQDGRWAIARCERCADDIRYRDTGPRALRTPGRIVTTHVDTDAQIVTASWRHGDAWGVRSLHLELGFVVDVTCAGHAPLAVAAVGSGAMAVLDGEATEPGPDAAERSPARSLTVVDVVSGAVLWSESFDGQPIVEFEPGWVRTTVGGSQTLRRLPDGAIDTMPEAAATFERLRVARWAEHDALPRRVEAVEGGAAFAEWSGVVERLTGLTPIMKLHALRHAGHDVVDFFAAPDELGREHLVIAAGERPRWMRRPTAGAGRTVDLVGGAWDPVGFHAVGRWLVSVTEIDLVELFPMT